MVKDLRYSKNEILYMCVCVLKIILHSKKYYALVS